MNVHAGLILLAERDVDVWGRLAREKLLLHIADNAHNFRVLCR
jgi:hypothetical protein